MGENKGAELQKRIQARADWSAPRISIRDVNERKSADRNISYDQLEARPLPESDAPETEKKFR